jgi:hypothetical protein
MDKCQCTDSMMIAEPGSGIIILPHLKGLPQPVTRDISMAELKDD